MIVAAPSGNRTRQTYREAELSDTKFTWFGSGSLSKSRAYRTSRRDHESPDYSDHTVRLTALSIHTLIHEELSIIMCRQGNQDSYCASQESCEDLLRNSAPNHTKLYITELRLSPSIICCSQIRQQKSTDRSTLSWLCTLHPTPVTRQFNCDKSTIIEGK